MLKASDQRFFFYSVCLPACLRAFPILCQFLMSQNELLVVFPKCVCRGFILVSSANTVAFGGGRLARLDAVVLWGTVGVVAT